MKDGTLLSDMSTGVNHLANKVKTLFTIKLLKTVNILKMSTASIKGWKDLSSMFSDQRQGNIKNEGTSLLGNRESQNQGLR